jgi:putative ABC transport system permease protein
MGSSNVRRAESFCAVLTGLRVSCSLRGLMYRLALKMLYGDLAKFIMLIGGLTVCSLLMTQQLGVFCGLMLWTTATARNVDVPIWVCDAKVEQVNEVTAMRDVEVNRVRSIEGIEWALPLHVGFVQTRLPNGDFQQVQLVGLDSATFVGRPARMTSGNFDDIRLPNAVVVDQLMIKKYKKKTVSADFPEGRELKVGDVFEINDKEARVVGICYAEQTFLGQPYVYTTYERSLEYAPQQRKMLSFVLAKPRADVDENTVIARIKTIPGLTAFTSREIQDRTIVWYIKNTGIPISFGSVVVLGIIVGIAISGQTFYLFVHENVRNLAALKAMGASNALLSEMVFLQALIVGTMGFGLGTGLTAKIGTIFVKFGEPPFFLPWQVVAFAAAVIFFICIFAASVGLLKVFRAEPAIVFR